MAETTLELTEMVDEIELAKYRRMANDAQQGHFPTYIYGDRDHIEVLAKALERCVDALEYDNAEDVVEQAKDKLAELEKHGKFLEEKMYKIYDAVGDAIANIKARSETL